MTTSREMGLTFDELRLANVRRCETAFHPLDEWTPADWMTAVAREVGEAANLIKKARRTDYADLDTQRSDIADEIADAVICLDLLAGLLGIDLDEAIVRMCGSSTS